MALSRDKIAATLPKDCRCNRYRSTIVKLHLYTIPLPGLKYIYAQLPLSLNELKNYVTCQTRLFKISEGVCAIFKDLVLMPGSLLLFFAGYSRSPSVKAAIYGLTAKLTKRLNADFS